MGLALLTTIALLVMARVLAGLDRWIYQAVQPLGGPVGDAVASAVTLLGRTDIAVGLAAVAAIVLVVRQRRLFPGLAPLAIFVVTPLADVLKGAVGQRRPPAGTGHDLQLIPSWLPKAGEAFSFPSNHAALAAFLVVVLGHAAPTLRPWLWIAASAVALSRLYLDKHWATDVLGGVLLGIVVGEAAWLVATVVASRVRR